MLTHVLVPQNTTPPPNAQTILAALSTLTDQDLDSIHSQSLWELMERDFTTNGILQ